LKSEGYEASEAELMAIVRRLDENGDSTISFREFQNFCTPLRKEIGIREFSSPSNYKTHARRGSSLRKGHSKSKPTPDTSFNATYTFSPTRRFDILPYRSS